MCTYCTEYNGTLNFYVDNATCFSVTRYSNVMKVRFLLIVNTYIQF